VTLEPRTDCGATTPGLDRAAAGAAQRTVRRGRHGRGPVTVRGRGDRGLSNRGLSNPVALRIAPLTFGRCVTDPACLTTCFETPRRPRRKVGTATATEAVRTRKPAARSVSSDSRFSIRPDPL
jgi:hypothetical protein